MTDAELDHTLGLLMLREADRVAVHATEAVYEILERGTSLLRTLSAYTRVEWRPVPLDQEVPLDDGLSYVAFPVPLEKQARFQPEKQVGRSIGYRITDHRTGRALVYAPSVQELTPSVLAYLEDCACLLFDGTFWRDDEMIRLGISRKTARQMGHLPISGPDGSLERLASLPILRRIYIHINNTNPILLEDAPERRVVEEHGFEVAADGLELEI